ncbi:MAG: endonuclease/exonuclease/phosphatase family metal-dependent hydrolase [Lentimonas sp.]|jgi:endonuclease/exonuclease/phosphatase family metal-dependent hydrolase
MRRYPILFVSLCLIWTLGAAETLRVATYNLENYLLMDRQVDGAWRPDYPKPESEKQIVREVIRSAAPDVLLVQEIGSAALLEELRLDLAAEGLVYPHAVHLVAMDTVRQVGLLSRIAPREVVRHTDLDFKYHQARTGVRRGLLEVGFDSASGERFSVFGVHLKSRWTVDERDPESQKLRIGEAEACRNRVIERTLERGQLSYMIAGDFNDHPNSAALRRFYQRGDVALGTLLLAADGCGERWTYFYGREVTYQLIDGFVLSADLLSRVNGAGGHISAHPHALQGSDHRLVYVDFDFPDPESQ